MALSRVVAVLAVGGLTAALAACGGDDPDSGGKGDPKRVSLTIPAQSLNFSQEVAEGFEYGVGTVGGVTADIGGPSFADAPGQLKSFQGQIAGDTAGASVFATAPQLFVKPLADAVRRGIPLISVDSPPPPGSGVGLYIGNDNVQLGRMLADQIVEELPAGTTTGTIVLGTTAPGAYVLEQRIVGMRSEFRKRLPRVTVLPAADTKSIPDANRGAWRGLIEAHPDAIAFAGTGDADALSLAALREETGGTWAAGAFDLEPKALVAVKNGDLVVVSPEHYLKGVLAGRLLAEHAATGKPLPKGWMLTPGLVITKANAEEVLNRQVTPSAKQQWFESRADTLLASPLKPTIPG